MQTPIFAASGQSEGSSDNHAEVVLAIPLRDVTAARPAASPTRLPPGAAFAAPNP
jgi:hypothetical protein